MQLSVQQNKNFDTPFYFRPHLKVATYFMMHNNLMNVQLNSMGALRVWTTRKGVEVVVVDVGVEEGLEGVAETGKK